MTRRALSLFLAAVLAASQAMAQQSDGRCDGVGTGFGIGDVSERIGVARVGGLQRKVHFVLPPEKGRT